MKKKIIQLKLRQLSSIIIACLTNKTELPHENSVVCLQPCYSIIGRYLSKGFFFWELKQVQELLVLAPVLLGYPVFQGRHQPKLGSTKLKIKPIHQRPQNFLDMEDLLEENNLDNHEEKPTTLFTVKTVHACPLTSKLCVEVWRTGMSFP